MKKNEQQDKELELLEKFVNTDLSTPEGKVILEKVKNSDKKETYIDKASHFTGEENGFLSDDNIEMSKRTRVKRSEQMKRI